MKECGGPALASSPSILATGSQGEKLEVGEEGHAGMHKLSEKGLPFLAQVSWQVVELF